VTDRINMTAEEFVTQIEAVLAEADDGGLALEVQIEVLERSCKT
jgi:hypothetical protein